jgi:cytochrome c oxidase assembly protein subunit 15
MLLAALISILILWGGIVRLTGSGLSIPEWPLINGSLLPPFTEAGWQTVFDTYAQRYPDVAANLTISRFESMFAVEYFHRFLAALVGVVFFAIIAVAVRNRHVWLQARKFLLWAAVLLVSQAVLGGIVVKLDLKALVVALHLGLAFFFYGLILYTSLKLSGDHSRNPNAGCLPWYATGAVYLQIMTGGLVAATGAGMVINTWPMMGAFWIPPWHLLWADWLPGLTNLYENQILVQFIHRWLAFIAAGFVIAMIARNIRKPVSPRGRIALRALASVLVLQLLLGIGNILMKAPFSMAFAHLAVGLVLFTVLVVASFELKHSS